MRKLIGGIIGLLCVCLFAGSCESDDCMLSSNSYSYMAFVDGAGRSVKLADTISVTTPVAGYDSLFTYRCDTDTVVSQVAIDSLLSKGYLLQIDRTRKTETIVNRKYGAQDLTLPLSYTAEEDTFYITYSPRLSDTLWVRHHNLPYFTSMDCGTVMHYKLKEVVSTHHLIDSVRIVAADVTTTLKENVKIYYTVSN